jgi:uncharacterized protein YdeI (YjbR/CyaY-like superfamily)
MSRGSARGQREESESASAAARASGGGAPASIKRRRPMKPLFFASPAEFRRWLDDHHATTDELVVGFHKRATGKPSLTWPESVDEALCFGWIDGIRKSIDEESYMIRFTPRKPESIWSAVNIRNVERLFKERRMRKAGLDAYALRKEFRSGIYSYEQRPAELVEPYASQFKKNKAAWKFFQSQPPGYRKLMTWFIVSAKTEETRQKRLARLIEGSAKGERLR